MNLDRMKEAVETCKATALDVEAVIEDVKTTMTGLEDNYMGEDADTLQEQMGKFLEDKVGDICRNAGAMERALAQGLENARFCKDYCQHFPDALEGGANGAVNDNKEIPGNLFCDYDAVMGLMDMCTEAENLGEEIRQSTYAIERVLDLEVVSFDVESYTSAVRAECDKIERLGAHRRNLENYGDFVETTDRELAVALAGIYDTFMTPESAQRSSLAYGNIDARIKKVQDRESELSEFQMEMLYEYMNKPSGSLTDEDRKAIDDILAGLFENEATDDLIKIVDSLGNGIWSAGQSYVAAKILVHSEETGNEEIASEIYNKLKREKLIWKNADLMGDTYETTYCYEVWMDSWKVKCMLKELKPEEEGLAYYSLQRRSKYATSTRKVLPSCCAEPKYAVALSFKTVDGKLVAVFDTENGKVELASVDMNKVVGAEGIANLQREGIHFSPEQIQTLMSCIYTDEDIIFIGNLSKAYTEKDYRKVFQSDPQALSIYATTGLYTYSQALLEESVEYDDKMKIFDWDYTQLEKFLNGMLYVKPDNMGYNPLQSEEERWYKNDNSYRYLKAVQEAGQIQLDARSTLLAENYDDESYVREQLPYYAENVQLLALYAVLEERKAMCSARGPAVYDRISGLGLYDDPDHETGGADMNHVQFSFNDNICFNDAPFQVIQDEKKESLVEGVRISKKVGDEILRERESMDYAEKVWKADHAFFEAAVHMGVAALTPDMFDEIGMVTDIAGSIASVGAAHEEAEEAKRRIETVLGGAQIMYTDDWHDSEHPGVLLTGSYDANALLKIAKIENEGLKGVVENKENKENMELIVKNLEEKIRGCSDSKRKEELYEQYLIYTGHTYRDESKEACPVQKISDMDPNSIRAVIDVLEDENREAMDRFDFIDYDIIESEYKNEKYKEDAKRHNHSRFSNNSASELQPKPGSGRSREGRHLWGESDLDL